VPYGSIDGVRDAPTILHLDMDAFYAAVEQAAKPSLRGKPVVVGGLGPRGVVATASYEARVFGAHSAQATGQARRLCPNAAYLVPRFSLYRQVSDVVMRLLHALSPLVEPLSLDEAFVDLEAGGTEASEEASRAVGERLREDIREATGLTGSVGLAGSKMLAKIASEQAKPDGLMIIRPGTERDLLAPMPVRTLPGVGPATAEHLRRAGMHTVGDMAEAGEDELMRLLGRANGASLHTMATGRDDRPVVAERDLKSVSVEDTFDVDLHDRARVRAEVRRLAERCVLRLREAGRSGRTVMLKVRRYDFSTLTRSETLRGPTDDPVVIREAAERLIGAIDTTGGVRLLGVGVSGLADFTQEDLFAQAAMAGTAGADPPAGGAADRPPEAAGAGRAGVTGPDGDGGPARQPAAPGEVIGRPERRWTPGHDVRHARLGPGWVQGSGLGRVTVRFEQPWSSVGPVRTFSVDDPALEPSDPLPLKQPAREPDARGPDAADDPDAFARHQGEPEAPQPPSGRQQRTAPGAGGQSSAPAIRPKSASPSPPPPPPLPAPDPGAPRSGAEASSP
jgi:DNA polymerase-4